MDSAAFEGLAGAQSDGWEMRFVGRIWEVLCFEAEAAMFEVIAGVELDAGFCGVDSHHAAGFGIFEAGNFDK